MTVFPDYLKWARLVMEDNPWVHPEPFESTLAKALEDAFNKGKAYGFRKGVATSYEASRIIDLLEKGWKSSND